MTRDMTPVQVEAALHRVLNDLARAQRDLANARDEEVEAKHCYESAYRRAVLSAECPQVSRTGVTVAYRDAWVAEKSAHEQRLYEVAEVKRRSAQDHLQTLRDQAMVLMALNKSMQTAFGLAGVTS